MKKKTRFVMQWNTEVQRIDELSLAANVMSIITRVLLVLGQNIT